jgi:hypothetical protein
MSLSLSHIFQIFVGRNFRYTLVIDIVCIVLYCVVMMKGL